MMKSKYTRVSIFGLISLLCVLMLYNLVAWKDYNTTVKLASSLDFEISIKQYSTGEQLDVLEQITKGNLLESLRKLEYNGVKFSVKSVGKEDNSYSIIVTNKEYQKVFFISQTDNQNYFHGNYFKIRTKRNLELLHLLDSLFE